MRFKLKTPSGPAVVSGEIVKRYKVVPLNNATKQDVTQFWTWLKYEFPLMDKNPNAKVFGSNSNDLNKIKSQWGTKFSFEV